jgi:hypothetical protein
MPNPISLLNEKVYFRRWLAPATRFTFRYNFSKTIMTIEERIIEAGSNCLRAFAEADLCHFLAYRIEQIGAG